MGMNSVVYGVKDFFGTSEAEKNVKYFKNLSSDLSSKVAQAEESLDNIEPIITRAHSQFIDNGTKSKGQYVSTVNQKEQEEYAALMATVNSMRVTCTTIRNRIAESDGNYNHWVAIAKQEDREKKLYKSK